MPHFLTFLDVSYAETQSDLSDFEGRVRALNDELRHRRQLADRLKRERKKRKREILKSKEDALKKQIEVGYKVLENFRGRDYMVVLEFVVSHTTGNNQWENCI